MEDTRYYHKRHSIGSFFLFKAMHSIDYIKPLKNGLKQTSLNYSTSVALYTSNYRT